MSLKISDITMRVIGVGLFSRIRYSLELRPFLELCLTVRRDVVEDCENAGRRESHVTSLRLSYLARIDSFSSRPAPKLAARRHWHVRFVPKADSCSETKTALTRSTDRL